MSFATGIWKAGPSTTTTTITASPSISAINDTDTLVTAPITATTSSSPDSNKKSKTVMPSSALPRTCELREEDDWTKVKDPKEKKRIQNRVAQRTYRHRMKARLGELQARLESHEARRSQSTEASDGSSGNGNPTNPMTGLPATSFPTKPDGIPDKPDQLPQQPMHFMQQPNLYEQPVDDPENSLFPQMAPHSGMLSSPPPSQPSPASHGLLSPPTHGDRQSQQGQRGGKNSQDFMVDCLRFQSQLLSRLNNLQQDTGFPGPYQGAVHNPMTQADQVNCVPAYTHGSHDGMDFAAAYGAAPVDMWKNDGSVKMQSPAHSAYMHGMTPSTNGSAGGSMSAPPPNTTSASMRTPKPSLNASLDERFECIMEQVEAAGFESFDSMATAYYTQNFSESSPLADQQRLSRNRRLPQVISDVYGAAASGWTDWERKNFQDEILRTAENMLAGEGGSARQMLGGKIGTLIEAQDNGNMAGADEALRSMKRAIQEELPNSWAVTMALAADNRQASWQRDRSDTVLATTLLLNFAGRVPNEQLLRLVSSCL